MTKSLASRSNTSASSVANAFGRLQVNDRNPSNKTSILRNPFGVLQDRDAEDIQNRAAHLQPVHTNGQQESAINQLDDASKPHATKEGTELGDLDGFSKVESRKLKYLSRATVRPPSIAPRPAPVKSTARPPSIVPSPASVKTITYRDDNDWRKPKPELQKQRWAYASTIGKMRQTMASGRTKTQYNGGPRTIDGVLLSDQVPGAIVWRYDVRPCRKAEPPKGWEKFVDPEDGDEKMRKGRYWIIVERDDEDVGECGIYTNNDTGLAGVSRAIWNKYFSLCPKDVNIKNFTNLVVGNPILEVKWMKDDELRRRNELLRTTMVVNWTEVRGRKLQHKDLRLVGMLSDASRDVLVAKAE
ncbi:hypothetical protein LTR37_011905 [Vermiconidia calcicola]|uniref:Uncharacterized protein n=1 Tax=Vermiconidia calcicola TaxID=1690605 RepID=A0ACC3N0T0_9PEZI|nr:hypothetical protein LTR37_011905 [Vermiconidia calcicola]